MVVECCDLYVVVDGGSLRGGGGIVTRVVAGKDKKLRCNFIRLNSTGKESQEMTTRRDQRGGRKRGGGCTGIKSVLTTL